MQDTLNGKIITSFPLGGKTMILVMTDQIDPPEDESDALIRLNQEKPVNSFGVDVEVLKKAWERFDTEHLKEVSIDKVVTTPKYTSQFLDTYRKIDKAPTDESILWSLMNERKKGELS